MTVLIVTCAKEFTLYFFGVFSVCLLQLLRAQKKVVKREQMAKAEAERRRLSTVLQVQQVLHGLQQEHIRRDLLTGCNHAPLVPAQRLHSLTRLTTLLGVTRDARLT